MAGPDYLELLVPVVGAAAGAVGIVTRDLYDRRSEIGRQKYAMEIATRQVNFAADWWKAKQALGCTPDDQDARATAESWLEQATSLMSETGRAPEGRKTEPSVARRLLLAYPLRRRTAKVLRALYYALLVFMLSGVLVSFFEVSLPDFTFGEAVALGANNVIIYGLAALGVRALAVSVENRNAKPGVTAAQRLSSLVSTSANPQAGWYPDPSGVAGQRYWDGRQWTAPHTAAQTSGRSVV
ncbi:Protein of unknown function (DUF2510) [Mycobacterium sp. JS623]|uniref:DUF2510 domain-containing protein n=1 Tax=Mycobacterium sp. JS623 TaxID=212767 RepID=UPI0002A57A6A|nr:DUF2510 domain-containing protein [Mycobacterium sp. JS623]AGB21294.1 Protein of unknown function (DUF2510) [Mycobacterium sp. JS623]